jgi:hypothetical protein
VLGRSAQQQFNTVQISRAAGGLSALTNWAIGLRWQ